MGLPERSPSMYWEMELEYSRRAVGGVCGIEQQRHASPHPPHLALLVFHPRGQVVVATEAEYGPYRSLGGCLLWL